ncbi:MAG: cytidylate kinase-like family protein [Pirellulales bacterium]|nr:cytidylate kinase-like family protein [Pirellulales bacterium]
MKEQIREEPKILAAAERQMHAHAMAAEIRDRLIRVEDAHRLAPRQERYLTIAREAGAGGGAIAALAGERLGWEVLDKNLLDRIAEQCPCCRMMLDLVDETPGSWLFDVLGTWMDKKIVPHNTFVAQLARVLLASVKRRNVVVVGRGAQFILPREKVFAVRIVASEAARVRRLMELKALKETEARCVLREIDRGRRDFVQRFFHRDVADPHLYDLVLNSQRLGIEGAVETLFSAMQGVHFLEPAAVV